MSTQEVFVRQFSRLFHQYQEALSADAEYENATWNAVPADERERMVAAARLALLELGTDPRSEESRRYFVKPGEAEWGC